MEVRDYAQELLTNAKEFKEYAFTYKRERQLFSDAINHLTGLIYKAGLCDDKASFENKLAKLLATPYAQEAKQYIEQMNSARGNYKGWEKVLDSYQTYISSIQSIIKWNLQGELTTAVQEKLVQNDIMEF